MNVRELNSLLVSWGRYWEAKETLQGYASVSSIEQCRQVLMLGLHSKSDKHLFTHQADSIITPDWVASIDVAIEQLEPNQRRIITRRYIKKSPLTRQEWIQLWRVQVTLMAVL